jgi:hypothetical protein
MADLAVFRGISTSYIIMTLGSSLTIDLYQKNKSNVSWITKFRFRSAHRIAIKRFACCLIPPHLYSWATEVLSTAFLPSAFTSARNAISQLPVTLRVTIDLCNMYSTYSIFFDNFLVCWWMVFHHRDHKRSEYIVVKMNQSMIPMTHILNS